MPIPTKVLVVFGTRPEAIKLFPLIKHLESDNRFLVRVCHTGQHRTLAEPILRLSGITCHHDLAIMVPEQSLDGLTAAALTAVGQVCDLEKPDWMIVQGDTTTAFAGALAAHYRQIPIAHVEAGLRSGDNLQPWPEEVNRRMISALATLHCAPTHAAAEALRSENRKPDTVHLTGNTGIDALHWMAAELQRQPELAARMQVLEERFAGKRLIGLTLHRRENAGSGSANVIAAVRQLAQREDVAIVCPCHPNPLFRRAMHEQLHGLDNVALVEPLGYPDFVRLLATAHIMLTDSGGVQEEAPSFGTPVLVLRETTERPEGITAGAARLVGTSPGAIVAEVSRLLDDTTAYQSVAQVRSLYGDGCASQRIVELLADPSMQPPLTGSRYTPGTIAQNAEHPLLAV